MVPGWTPGLFHVESNLDRQRFQPLIETLEAVNDAAFHAGLDHPVPVLTRPGIISFGCQPYSS
jgi:hypothetical protein